MKNLLIIALIIGGIVLWYGTSSASPSLPTQQELPSVDLAILPDQVLLGDIAQQQGMMCHAYEPIHWTEQLFPRDHPAPDT